MKRNELETTTDSPRPKEEPALRALAAVIQRPHADALTRMETTPANISDYAEMLKLAKDAQDAVVDAYGRSTDSAPEPLRNLTRTIESYINTATGTQQSALTGADGTAGSLTSPAIESMAVRAAVHRMGIQLLELIEDGIQKGEERDRKARTVEAALRQSVTYWLQEPVIRALINALHEVTCSDLAGIWLTKNVVDSLHIAMRQLASIHERESGKVVRVLPTSGGSWRTWLPMAVELLDDDDDAKKTKAAA